MAPRRRGRRLLHTFVDFDLQIPAIPVLLVRLVAMRPDAPSS